MAWQGLHISEPARLSLDQRMIVVARGDGLRRFPLEDVAWIALDTPQATVTSALVSACAAAGLIVVFCDGKHMPNGIMLPFHTHHRQAGMLRCQIETPVALSQRLWRRIVRRKIRNQADLLEETAARGAADLLRAMADHVHGADADNVEARAARTYWPILFRSAAVPFRRHDEDRRNAMLNYGYALVRAMIARTLVAHGFVPALGLHHDSAANAFNLADDLIEPFRPVVDRAALGRLRQVADGAEMTRDDRRALLSILGLPVTMSGGAMAMADSISSMIASLGRALETGSSHELCLPRLGCQD